MKQIVVTLILITFLSTVALPYEYSIEYEGCEFVTCGDKVEVLKDSDLVCSVNENGITVEPSGAEGVICFYILWPFLLGLPGCLWPFSSEGAMLCATGLFGVFLLSVCTSI